MLSFFAKRRGEKGFTLIELLVVIAIIGILATIVLVSLNSARQKARDTRRIGDLRQVAVAMEMYADDNSAKYPFTALGTCDDWGAIRDALQLNSKYMTKVPTDPVNSGTSVYTAGVAENQLSYVLRAILENTANTAYNDDVDGTVLTCDCGPATGQDTHYCVKP